MSTKPIEITHQNIYTKLDIINDLVKLFSIPSELDQLVKSYSELSDEYKNTSISLLCEYHNTRDPQVKYKIIDKYNQNIISKNFVVRMDNIINALNHKFYNIKNVNQDTIKETWQQLYNNYNNISVELIIKKIDYKKCPLCGYKTTLYPAQSEIRCTSPSCDYTMYMKGIVFDDQIQQENRIQKRSLYETSRHCSYHLDRILAIKVLNNIEHLKEKILNWATKNNHKYLKLLSCKDYRRCLKDIGETKYNEHVPFLRLKISGVSPDRLYHHEKNQVKMYFEIAVSAFNKLYNNTKTNLRYYPYFIFKIIEIILSAPENHRRFLSIADCIHFQRDGTIITNDNIWQSICEEVQEELPDFVFKKTDVNII